MKRASFPRRRALQVLGAAVLAGSAGRLLSATRNQALIENGGPVLAGKGAKATCVAYVDALANRAVAATLVPPSYSYGALGTWQARP
jgi:hypothetical protein